MSTPTPSTAPSNPARGGRHRYRSQRGNHQNQGARAAADASASATSTVSDTSLALHQVPVAPTDQSEGPGTSAAIESRNHIQIQSHGYQGRGGRGGRGSVRPVATVGGGRTFGGQLTQPLASSTSLHAEAPEFNPGQAVHSSLGLVKHGPTRARRMSKSMAPDLTTRTHDDISNGLYECPICTSEVLRNSKIWSCGTCWTVFHMPCIERWAKNEGSTQQQQRPGDNGNMPPPRQWRCPGCNLPQNKMPDHYACWCGKEVDPKPIPGIPPHSCGQTCSKLRAPRKCPHPCELLCHAGPCPPCPHIGPAIPCFCGKDIVARRCIDTDYDNGWSCGKICGDLLPCGEHTCKRGCHEGLCGSCEVLMESRCYCGKVEKSLSCSLLADRRTSQRPYTDRDEVNSIETWIGSFDCETQCGRLFDCGKHTCKKYCHEQTLSIPHCPYSPDAISHCPCGKSSLAELGCERRSCEDLVIHCKKKCEKRLPCGHLCQQTCHDGECIPCVETVQIKCRCGRTTSSTVCHQGREELPQCFRPCKSLLNCGRHECGERCCPAEKIAEKRQAAKRKMKSLSAGMRNNEEEFEAEHICTRTCGRQLKCGNSEHTCLEFCHRGPCGSCREAIFEEVTCRCGKTVLHPPLPCGTQPPVCQYQCDRPKACGHPQVQHQCHMDDVSCPKCPYLVQKPCMCGKAVLKNQPCWLNNIGCGQACGRRLRCGIHHCQKTCHRPGDCEDAGKPCPHPCHQKKTAPGCGHVCPEPCHAPYPCKEDKPCQSKIIITCECQNLKQEVKCLASKSKESSPPRRTLTCDDECLRLQRNRRLAEALNISSDHMDDHIPYSTTTLDMFKNMPKWCQTQEREFRLFAVDASEKRLRFKPTSSHHRAFLHCLAEDFGLDSESMDPEPHRHVVIFKTPRFVSAPAKTLAQCLKIKQKEEPTVFSGSRVQTIEPLNALILSSPRFALTVDELRTQLKADLSTTPLYTFGIEFLPSEEVVLYPKSNATEEGLEMTLTRLKPLVAKTVKTHSLAVSVSLCRIDSSLNVIRRDHDMDGKSGWSQVVKGAPLKSAPSAGWSGASKSSFTVLGNAARLKGKERGLAREQEPFGAKESKKEKGKGGGIVVDNWENALDAEEGVEA